MYETYVYTICMKDTYIKDKKKPTTVTLSESLLKEARELGVNVSQFSEDGLRAGIKKLKEKQWREENREAIEATNREVRERGLLFEPIWMKDDYHGSI